jgi:tetratricopeptide (TPR) repeat protein
MKHGIKNHMMISAAVLAAVATAAVACSSPSQTTAATASSPSRTTASATSSASAKGAPASLTNGNGSSQVTSLLQTGLTQTGKKNWSAATTTFKKVLAINPTNVYADYDLGWIAQTRGNSSEAISYYTKCLAANAAYTPAMYNEAILLESAHPQQAIAMYQKIVRVDSKASSAYLRMALVQAEQGDTAAAKANDAKAVSIDPALSKYKLPAKN